MKNNFWDIRQHGFFRVATASPRVFLADPQKNALEHLKWIKKVSAKGAQLIVFPELSLTGYSCQDLFLSSSLQQASISALTDICQETKDSKAIIILGLPLQVGDRLFNVAAILNAGQIIAIIPKTYLPDYREFRENRWFATARHAHEKEIIIDSQTVPFGTDILVGSSIIPNLRIAVDICEDLWMPIPPTTQAALNGATLLVNLSGSNITLTKDEYRQQLVESSSAKNIAVQVYSSAGFGESTTDSAWDSHGIIADRGQIITETKRFSLNGSFCLADVDLDTLIADRQRMSSFRDNAQNHHQEYRRIVIEQDLSSSNKNYHQLYRFVDPHPFVPSDPLLRNKRCQEVFQIQTTSLARRLLALPKDKRKIIIGISGGLDSTQALLVAAKTMDLLKIPRNHIIGLTMPGFGTTDRTYQNAVQLIKATGATFREIPIKDISTLIFKQIGHSPTQHDLTFENTQAWARKYIELAVAGKEGGLVLGTSDLSELWLGWCTMYGDHASHYAVNSSVPKTLVSHMVNWVAEAEFTDNSKTRQVLQDILATPISPELLPAKKEKIVQKTEDTNGPYELHDFFGYYFVRFGMTPAKIARLAFAAFSHKYPVSEIKTWLKIFLTRFFINQYKRSTLPDGPKVGSVGPSPRDEWRMPSDATVDTWLADWQTIPEK